MLYITHVRTRYFVGFPTRTREGQPNICSDHVQGRGSTGISFAFDPANLQVRSDRTTNEEYIVIVCGEAVAQASLATLCEWASRPHCIAQQSCDSDSSNTDV